MEARKNKRRAVFLWLFVATLLALCGILGVLQYRWIGEVSIASRERLRGSLQASLHRLSQDFNAEITTACRALAPAPFEDDAETAESELAAHYEQWRKASRHSQIFSSVAVAVPEGQSLALRTLDPQKGVFETAAWPVKWQSLRDNLESKLSGEPWRRRPPDPFSDENGAVFEVPIFKVRQPGPPMGPFGAREALWLILDLNLPYVRDVLLPELLQRHLGASGSQEYQVEVLTRTTPPSVIYPAGAKKPAELASRADASVGLFEVRFDQILHRGPRPGMRGRGPGPSANGGPARGPGPGTGRWQMYVRHRAGSLEAVVAQARWRNLAVTASVLLFMVASAAALIQSTRRAQRLAELQMDFVAGVSHELRTPLTVIHTAAYNLRGGVANDPGQVERYGALIQKESGRLKDLVEQVLQFSSANAGRVIQEPEPLSVETLIDETVESTKAAMQASRCVVEKTVDPELPLVLGDPTALKHALQNLLSNAAKYGTSGSNWIGVSASRGNDPEQSTVEIRVTDRGPGIPADEQLHIFDPFFRGKRAVQDQVHGTGLGLNLVSKIVEAHGGSIRVKSEPMKGTEFIVRLPAAPAGATG